MKILIDIGHPAHVHIFKHFAWDMQKKGHEIFFTCREKEFEIYLLEKYGFNYNSFGKKYSSKLGKLLGLVEFDIKELLSGLKVKPDLFLSHGSIYAAHAAFLMRKPHISLEDTFNFEQIKFYLPFTTVVLTGDYNHPVLGAKEIKYSGYHELAYLHPKYYNPDKNILTDLNVVENEKYVILRFVSWKATHDSGHSGISMENKIKAVKAFNRYARVFISSEVCLPAELSYLKFNLEPHRMHDALAFASLVFGESSTMSEEAAMLGVPSIYLFNNSTYYTTHLEECYSLLFNYSESFEDQEAAIEKGIDLLLKPDLKQEWQKRRQRMLQDKIDVTAFLVWLIENYPNSLKIIHESPDYQHNFKSNPFI